MKALLELNCIPCGMEYFPAANEDQWTFIQKLIDSCDYYIVIVGGKYGSEDEEGKSYTQKEYEYALSMGIPTIGFIYPDRASLDDHKKDSDPEKIQKLEAFISLVRSKLCKDWHNAYELGAVVSRSLTQLRETNPRTGWVRADKIASEDLLSEINALRKEGQVLKDRIGELENTPSFNIDLSHVAFDQGIAIEVIFYVHHQKERWTPKTTWKEIFVLLSPYLLEWDHDNSVSSQIATSFLHRRGVRDFSSEYIDSDDLQSIKVQFLALDLIEVQQLKTAAGGMGLYWRLTKKGRQTMLVERSVKKKKEGVIEEASLPS